MNRTARAAVGLLFLSASAVATAGCADEVVVGPADYPPAAFLATAQPVYYEGRPAYFYGNRWYYRNGASWGAYRSEPEFLSQRRPGVGVGYRYNVHASVGVRRR